MSAHADVGCGFSPAISILDSSVSEAAALGLFSSNALTDRGLKMTFSGNRGIREKSALRSRHVIC